MPKRSTTRRKNSRSSSDTTPSAATMASSNPMTLRRSSISTTASLSVLPGRVTARLRRLHVDVDRIEESELLARDSDAAIGKGQIVLIERRAQLRDEEDRIRGARVTEL